MDRVRFRDWFSNIDELTAARCPGARRTVFAASLAEGARNLNRRPREQMPTLVAADRVCGTLHIQIKGFLRCFRGIATKCLDSYLRWFHLVVLGRHASPRACLVAARSCTH